MLVHRSVTILSECDKYWIDHAIFINKSRCLHMCIDFGKNCILQTIKQWSFRQYLQNSDTLRALCFHVDFMYLCRK